MSERMRLTRIADVPMKRLERIEERLILRAMLTGLVAPGGTGKGLFGVHHAARLATREERTLFLCSEDALNYIVRPRFEAAGCDGRLAVALDIEDKDGGNRNLRFSSDIPTLAAAIEQVEPTLVIIDPFASHLDHGLQMSRNNEVREALEPLITLAQESGAGIIPVYHTGKDRSRGALESVAFEDACRNVLTAARDDEDDDVRHIEVTKSNVGPVGYGRKLRIIEVPLEIEGETVSVAKLVDEGRSGKSVADLLAARRTRGPDASERDGASRLLREILIEAGESSVNADEIKRRVMTETGVSKATVWRAFNDLREQQLVGAAPERDEFGSVTEWRWFAKTSLLLGRGDG